MNHFRSLLRCVAAMVLWCAAENAPAVQPSAADRAEISSPFAVDVVAFDPAPGQFVNSADFSDPLQALGPPEGEGAATGNNTSVVNLGGFGGSIVLRFDHIVEDHPLNPMGLDAIVFGNAFYVGGDSEARWAECATIEIGLDGDGSGDIEGNERWYLVAGSHIPSGSIAPLVMTWDDDLADMSHPPALASWIPPGRSGAWNSRAIALPPDVFESVVLFNDAPVPGDEGVWGYADTSPTLLRGDFDGDDIVDDPLLAPEDFYTVPDDPLTMGVDEGSAGGDAFDIAWAIDPVTGQPANLVGFDMIRITNPTHIILGPIGEKSPEIDAVADVRADPFADANADEDIDLRDLSELWICFDPEQPAPPNCLVFLRFADDHVDSADAEAALTRITGPR